MHAAAVHPQIEIGPIRPPQRLAPFSYAIGAEVRHPETAESSPSSEGDAFGRLILLHDPEGDEAWDGTMRLVAYIQADLDPSVAATRCCPRWRGAGSSMRWRRGRARHRARRHRHRDQFGAVRRHRRPPRAHQLELRASWTATTPELAAHVEAFCEVLAYAAGLPPAGVTDLGSRSRA